MALVHSNHTDDSTEVKYFDRPAQTIDKMAFTFTDDLGCEFGPSKTTSTGLYEQGGGCHGKTGDANSLGGDHFGAGINPKQSFIGFMLYDRTWFKRDTYAVTIGGGRINNPGRYLVLIPPINGETDLTDPETAPGSRSEQLESERSAPLRELLLAKRTPAI